MVTSYTILFGETVYSPKPAFTGVVSDQRFSVTSRTVRRELLLPGLLDGEHRFLLETNDNGQTRFVQHDLYSGALAPLLMDFYGVQAESGFHRMNEALKKRAETLGDAQL